MLDVIIGYLVVHGTAIIGLKGETYCKPLINFDWTKKISFSVCTLLFWDAWGFRFTAAYL